MLTSAFFPAFFLGMAAGLLICDIMQNHIRNKSRKEEHHDV